MVQGGAGEAKLVISPRVVSVNAQRVSGVAKRGPGLGAAVGQRGHLDQGRKVVGVLLQARLECLGSLQVGALTRFLLTHEVKAVNGGPIEAGGRSRGPAEHIPVSGGVLELVPAEAHSQRLGG